MMSRRGFLGSAAVAVGATAVNENVQAAGIPEAQSVRAALTEAGVEHRYWYGFGLHREPYFADAASDALPGRGEAAGTGSVPDPAAASRPFRRPGGSSKVKMPIAYMMRTASCWRSSFAATI